MSDTPEQTAPEPDLAPAYPPALWAPPSRREALAHAVVQQAAIGQAAIGQAAMIRTALGFAAFGIAVAAKAEKIDQFNYVTTLAVTPLFLVAGTFFPISQLPEGFQILAQLNPLHQLVVLVRGACFGFDSWDLLRVAALTAFTLVLWRVAVNLMRKRLID